MTKHRKGTTKHRKSIRIIKNRRYKTRRQSGGFGWDSFIRAEDNYEIANPVGGISDDPELMVQMIKAMRSRKGIDVKVKTVAGQRKWLIGGKELTLRELEDGGKEGRYVKFISVLLRECPTFTYDNETESKGIILTDDQFCRIFIGEPGKPGTAKLNYTNLQKKFREKGWTCTYDSNLQKIKDMKMDVTDGEIEMALKKAHGNVDNAASILLGPSAASGRPSGRPSGSASGSAYHPPSSAAQQREQPPPMTLFSDIGVGGIATAMPQQLQKWPQPSAVQPYWPPSSAAQPYWPPSSADHPPPSAAQPYWSPSSAAHWPR
jgi:hypothetical protein